MSFFLKKTKDLTSQKVMESFFKSKCLEYFGVKDLISLKIFPKKTLSGNILIFYKLSFFKKGKRFSKNIWGKTIKERQFNLLKFLAKTKVKRHIPNYFDYFPHLKFSLSEDIGGKSARLFEQNFSFWKRNLSKIAKVLVKFQEIEIPDVFLKSYSKNREKEFVRDVLEKIKSYSLRDVKKYEKIKNYYIKNLFSKCWKKNLFSFCHFDFQPSNTFYVKKTRNFVLLDFDLAKKFHPALDLANFWVHFYVMARYHFSQKKVLSLCDKFLRSYFKEIGFNKNLVSCFYLFRLRTILDIAKITSSVFGKPSKESQKVFDKLNELIKICL